MPAAQGKKGQDEDGSLLRRRLNKDRGRKKEFGWKDNGGCNYIMALALMDGWLSVMGMLSVCKLLKELLGIDVGGAMPF